LQILRKEKETEEELANIKLGNSKRASCPGNCNGQGRCDAVTGLCQCNQNWGGDDCSYEILPLTSGRPTTSQTVSAQRWIFYTINVNGGGLLVVVNQTSQTGDADLYLLQNELPSRTKYSQRDITTNRNFAIQVDNAGTQTWYIGIYGFGTVTYTITATTTGQCADLNNCNSPNGVCIAAHTCQCNAGYTGPDCSERSSSINPGVKYTGSVAWMDWVFYTISVTTGNTFMVSLNQTSDGDLDLYLKFGDQPTLWDFDYQDSSSDTNVALRVDNPQRGTWYIGIYGYTSGSYNLIATDGVQCPNNCSAHGVCRGVDCYCNTGFRGTSCEFMINDMQDGVPVRGYVSDNTWNYYHMKANTQNNLLINVQQLVGPGYQDCDLYAKPGVQPTKFDFAYRNIGFDRNFTLTITDPSDEMWYFGVYGYSSNCSYTITASVSTRCPGTPACSNRGQCVNGVCVCNQGWSGPTCSLTMATLTNGGSPSNGLVNARTPWNFFTIQVTNTTFLAVEVKETRSKGYVWVYASKGRQPDSRNYDESDKETNSKFHRIHLEFDTVTTEQWIIGVYANPYAIDDVPYQIAAWYPPF